MEEIEYKRIILHIPSKKPEKDFKGWELEKLLLKEHLDELINSYGENIFCELLDKLLQKRSNELHKLFTKNL